ncbi:hypothetical protein C1I38_00590 [Dehalobacter sp. 12DCB1]|nr:hypothetical protein C1I38_00590 [Dehalobacter sp. 12DCB1]
MLYAFIVRNVLNFCNGAILFFLCDLQFLDRRLDFPQEHFGNIAGGGSQAGNGIQCIEIGNVLKIL